MNPSIIDLAGYAASALVFLTFSMKTLFPLRVVAIASNVAFLSYGYLAGLTPILILHGLLLPLNVLRTWELLQLQNKIKEALQTPPSIEILLPHMTKKKVDSGTVICRIGEAADRLYYIADGSVRIAEVDKIIEAGALFGEIGLFTADQTRTATVIAEEPTELYWIDREVVHRLYQAHPEFGLVLTRLVAERLAENQSELLARLETLSSDAGAKQDS